MGEEAEGPSPKFWAWVVLFPRDRGHTLPWGLPNLVQGVREDFLEEVVTKLGPT